MGEQPPLLIRDPSVSRPDAAAAELGLDDRVQEDDPGPGPLVDQRADHLVTDPNRPDRPEPGRREHIARQGLRAAPHICQRGDLDQVAPHVASDLVVVHQVVQGVEQRPQIRVDLVLEVAGEEAEVLARLLTDWTGLPHGPREARERWKEVERIATTLKDALGSPVSLQTALFHYFHSVQGLLREPRIVSEKDLSVLRVNAITDPLTGLYNRRFLLDHLNREIARADFQRSSALGSPCCVSSSPVWWKRVARTRLCFSAFSSRSSSAGFSSSFSYEPWFSPSISHA